MTTRSTRLATAAGAAALGLTLLASPAGADVGAQGKSISIRTASGGAYFWDFGDKVSVSDYRTDGRGIQSRLYYDGKTVVVAVKDGVNNNREVNLEIKEGTKVSLQMCYTKGGVVQQCSKTYWGTA